jgi:hypothetical protein
MAPAALLGRVVPVTVTEIGSNSLFGELAEGSAAAELIAAGA